MKRIICCISITIKVLFLLHLCQAEESLDKNKVGKYESLGNTHLDLSDAQKLINAEQTTPKFIVVKTPERSPLFQVIRGPVVTASATPKPMPGSKNSSAIQIVSRKCQEYGKLAYQEDLLGGQLPGSNPKNKKKNLVTCKYVAQLPERTPIRTKEYPHMALIGYGENFNNVSWECDGVLISEKFIMSSARCSKSSASGPPKWVILKELDVTVLEQVRESRVYNVVKIHVHPNYKSSSYHHDISLIELNTTVKFKPYMRPACLHTSTSDVAIEKLATITGWERTGAAEHEQTSDILLKALVVITDHQECEALFNENSIESNSVYDPNTMICARDALVVDKDYGLGCKWFEGSHIKADSGSPLQIENPDLPCMRNIIGIASFGTSICQGRTNPGIYTKVSHYVDWIQSVVWP